MTHVVIVGGGHAAGQMIGSLRHMKYEGEVTLISEEPYLPYQRPPLSKAFLAGELPKEKLPIYPDKIYDMIDCNRRLGVKVDSIDRAAKTLSLADGSSVAYGKLVLCTGAKIRVLDVPGADLQGIHYLRTIDDVEGIQKDFAPGKKLVVVGGGYIGLEVAAVARKHGIDVKVLEATPRILQRVVAPVVSEFYTRIHTEEGVEVLTNVMVSSFDGDGHVARVNCADGQSFDADFVVIGVGIMPNDDLAREAGLTCTNGVDVNEHSETSDPNIFAAGDCASHPSPHYGARLRIESVQNAADQAKAAAGRITGNDKHYDAVPWFWSDQYDLKLQIAGLSQGHDDVIVRGDPESRSVSFIYLKDGVVIACDSVNRIPDFMSSKKLILAQAKVDPARLADVDVPLKVIVKELQS